MAESGMSVMISLRFGGTDGKARGGRGLLVGGDRGVWVGGLGGLGGCGWLSLAGGGSSLSLWVGWEGDGLTSAAVAREVHGNNEAERRQRGNTLPRPPRHSPSLHHYGQNPFPPPPSRRDLVTAPLTRASHGFRYRPRPPQCTAQKGWRC